MKKYLSIVVILLSLSSCNSDPVIPEVLCENYQEPSPSQITIGQTTGMLTRTDLGFIPSGMEANTEMSVTLECQTAADMVLKTQTSGSLGTGSKWEIITLIPASNVKFHQSENADTIYHFSDTTYNGSNPVYYGVSTGEHCVNETSTHYPGEISDKLIYHNPGDLVSKSGYFKSETKTLRTSEYSFTSGSPVENDTVSINVYDYDNSCNNIAESQEVYIAFTKEVDGQIKLGWIKLWHEYNVKTEVLEYAIQE